MFVQPSTSSVEGLPLANLALEEPKGVDYLSQLPPEILRTIFRLVYSGPGFPPLPLSRHLKPFHNENRFAVGAVDCNSCLGGLMKTMSRGADLAQYVKVLMIDMKPGASTATAPAFQPLAKFLRRLKNLRFLSISGPSPVLDVVLRPNFAKQALGKLKTLQIKSSFLHVHRLRHPFDPHHYEALNLYRSLVDFSIRVERPYNEYNPLSSLPRPSSSQYFARLQSLDISGKKLDGNALRGILFGCKELTSLVLNDGSGEVDLVAITKELPRLSSLRELTLRSFVIEDATPEERPVVPLLRKTPLLESLDLLGPFDTTSPTFLDALYSLPLRKLAIGLNTPLHPQLLFSLLHPKTRHPSLRTLDLDNIFAVRGASTDPDDFEDIYFDEDEEPIPPPGWILPAWPEDESWSPSIIEEIREAADKANVEVSGTTFDAEEIEEEYDEELRKVDAYWEMMEETIAEEEAMMEAAMREEEDNYGAQAHVASPARVPLDPEVQAAQRELLEERLRQFESVE